MLLQWCTLEPSGPSSLAALRFKSPVRIQKITIYPTTSEPFTQLSGVESRTEPEAFFLQLFFNAHPVPRHGVKEKQKPSNALISTVVAYAGGKMDFMVNMSPEFATLLMIVKGRFESVSMAIYGDIVHEIPPPPTSYEAKPIPSFDPIPLSPALNTAHFRDPTQLASQLLNLMPDAPPLSLIITLMFCLKPSNDDWDLPEFPYMHPNLDEDHEDPDLDWADRLTTQPVAVDTKPEVFERFAEQVARAIGPKDENQAYYIAGVLAHAASQLPEMARALLRSIDLSRVFDAVSMDESTLERLSDAVCNVDIARELNTEPFLNAVRTIERDATLSSETRSVARQLLLRIEGVLLLEDAISNTQGDFARAASALCDISAQEQSFGIWVASMITHSDLAGKLSENAIVPSNSLPLPLLLSTPRGSISHDDFVTFLRAFIGAACVLAVYAWADSLPHQKCRERTLGILRLWTSVDGYREILEHLMLLRQMVFRLECMLDSGVPTRSGIDAEHILVSLAKNPSALLRDDFMQCILSLKPPHSYITEEERFSMRQAALISEDGLPGAIDELVREMERPPSFKSLRALRVALAVVLYEIKDHGEYDVLREFWDEGSCSLVTCLTEIFLTLSEEISSHFRITSPSTTSPELLTQLFTTSNETLRLLLYLTPSYLVATRIIRSLVASAADLFVCTDLADNLYSQTSSTCIAAQDTRQSCIDLVRAISERPDTLPDGKLAAEVILHTLLEHGLRNGELEPARHLLQVFCLVDCLLPMPDTLTTGYWTQKVLPNVLHELWEFCRSLDTENKAHFVRRLIGLDKGVIGIGDWLILQELTELGQALAVLEQPDITDYQKLLQQHQVSHSLQFFADLLNSSSSVSNPCIRYLYSDPDAATVFASCLQSIFQQDIISPHLRTLLYALNPATHDVTIGQEVLHFPLALNWLRGCRNTGVDCSVVAPFLQSSIQSLKGAPREDIIAETLSIEVSCVIMALNDFDDEELDIYEIPIAIVEIIEFYIAVFTKDGVKPKIYSFAPPLTASQFFLHRFEASSIQGGFTKTLEARLDFITDPLPPRLPISLPDTPLSLSIHELASILHPPSLPPPSTPRKAKTVNQDVLSLVTFSPPTAVIRSSVALTTGLTKTYLKNDFRQLRSTPSARQNTSRLPSMHVDDFENVTNSPTQGIMPLAPLAPLAGMSGTMTMGSPNIPTIPFATAAPDILAPGFSQAFHGTMMPPS